MRNQYISKLLPLWLFLALGGSAVAVQNNWTGAGGDMLWTNSANWSLGVLPDSTQDVSIDGTGTNAVALNAPAQAASFLLGSNAVLNLAGDLSVATSATIDGTLDWVSGELVVTNTVISSSGSWTMRSTAPCNLWGNILNNGTISCFATQITLRPYSDENWFTNSHLFVLNTNLTVSGGWWPQQFYNSGTLLVPAGNSNLILTAASRITSSGTIRVETNSSITIRQGAPEMLMFRSGTVFDGEGLTRLTDGAGSIALDTLSTSGDITVNGTVEIGGGRVYGSSGVVFGDYNDLVTVWSGPGLLRWPVGALINFTFAPDFHVEISGATNKQFAGACTNYGTIRWTSNSSLSKASYPPEANFCNHGEMVLEADCALNGPFFNGGTIRVPANKGTVNFSNAGGFDNSSLLLAETNSTLNVSSDGGIFYPGTLLDGQGVVRFLSGQFAYPGDLIVNGTVELAGAYFSSSAWPTVLTKGTWAGPGLLRWSSGRMVDFVFPTNFNVEIAGAGSKEIYGECTNFGTIHWTSAGPLGAPNGGRFNNLGELLLETNCTMSSGQFPAYEISFANSGIIRVPPEHGLVNLTLANATNSGPVQVGTNSTLQIGPFYGMSLGGGTVFNGPGTVRLAAEGIFYCISDIEINTTVELDSQALAWWSIGSPALPTLKGNGVLRWLNGILYQLTIASNLTVEAVGPGIRSIFGDCTNWGTIRLEAGTVKPYYDVGSLWNGGTFTVSDGGTWNTALAFTNGAGGIFRQTGGQFSAGSFDNAGTMELMGSLNSGGDFVFEPGSVCKLTLTDSPLSTYINAGTFYLDGALTVALADGFAPTNGSIFSICTNFSLPQKGQFAAVSLPRPGSTLTWVLGSFSQTLDLALGVVPTLSSPVQLSDGAFQFALSGVTGGTYEIQASTNLVDWSTLTNAPFSGSAVFIDPAATNFIQRFYRGLVQGP